jgi:hypothetical protein
MTTIEDYVGVRRLTADEITAVAEYEHLADTIVLEMGHCLFVTAEGQQRLSHMIVDDIEAATAVGNLAHIAKVRRVLQHVLEYQAGVALTRKPKA